MSAGHTSGPWEVQEPMDHELWIVEAGKEAYEWRVIAGLPWPEEKGDISRKQVEANARLIAAAPELLEVAEKLSAMWKSFQDSDGNYECAYYRLAKYHWATWGALNAAIAKATGQEGGAL